MIRPPTRILLAATVAIAHADCQSAAASGGEAGIVFCSDRDGGWYRLYRMTADGRDVRALLPPGRAEHRDPAPAPDGRSLVFTAISGGRSDLVVVALDGDAAPRQLTDSGADDQPHVAPDGRQIVFRSRRDGDSALFVCRADGSGTRRLSPRGAHERWPRWSPDGTRIAFSALADGSVDLWTMAADGGDRRRLTRGAGIDARPTWRPDGRALLFHASASDSAKHDAIMAIEADGSGRRTLHGGSAIRERYVDRNTASWGPVCSADGRTILFVSTRTGNAEIFRMDAAGRGVRRLTTNRAQDDMAAWLPEPR